MKWLALILAAVGLVAEANQRVVEHTCGCYIFKPPKEEIHAPRHSMVFKPCRVHPAYLTRTGTGSALMTLQFYRLSSTELAWSGTLWESSWQRETGTLWEDSKR